MHKGFTVNLQLPGLPCLFPETAGTLIDTPLCELLPLWAGVKGV